MPCSLIKSLKTLSCLLLLMASSISYGDQRTKIMLFGDSLMAGYGLTQSENLASVLADKFEKGGSSKTIINSSVSGNTSNNGLARLDWSLEYKPDVVVLCLGGNDMLRGINPQITKDNLKAMIIKIQKQGIILILAGMRSPVSMGQKYQEQFNQIYPDLAEQHNLVFMPFLLEDVAFEELHMQHDYKHPNASGIEIIANNLYPYLIKSLELYQLK